MNFKFLSDIELENILKASVIEETKSTTKILHLLAEIERRRLYSKEFPSLFEYCVKVLKYSGSSAQRRIDTMRAMKLIPEIEQKIVAGELNLTSVAQAQSFFRQEAKIGKVYSKDQKVEVLNKLQNKSTRECIQEFIAISPQSVPQEKRRELTPEKTELRVVLNKELIGKLDKIKALMSHQKPNMTDQELIEVMAEALLEKIDPLEKAKRSNLRKQKLEQKGIEELKEGDSKIELINRQKSLPAPAVKNLRYIPAKIKREVYLRDHGQCTHPQCHSKKFLEYDHIQPLALGGETTIQNLRLLCKAHNQRAAIFTFGLQKMQDHWSD